MKKIRTDVEKLLLNEMIEEDANYLIMGDNDADIEAVVPSNYDNGLFSNSSSEDDLLYDDDLFDEDDDLDELLNY